MLIRAPKSGERKLGKALGTLGGAPPLLAGPELVPAMLVSQRMSSCRDNRVGLGSAFEVLEPYAGKLARTVLRGAGGP